MATREITGALRRLDGSAWPGATIKFALLTDYAVASTATMQQTVTEITTTASGGFAVDLEVPDSNGWRYQCVLPDGQAFEFLLEAGATTTLRAIIADLTIDVTEEVEASIASLIAGKLDAISGGTAGNFVTQTAGGAIQDAGVSIASFIAAISGGTVGNVPTISASGQLGDSGTALSDMMLLSNRNYVNAVVDHSADNTGATDSSAAFTSAVTAAVAANKPLYIPAGNYTVESAITISGTLEVFGDGITRTVITAGSTNIGLTADIFTVTAGHTLHLRDLKLVGVRGGADTTSTNTAVRYETTAANDLIFERVWFDSFWARAFRANNVAITNLTITNCKFINFDRLGLDLGYCSNIHVVENYFENCALDGTGAWALYVTGSGTVDNIVITDNIAKNCKAGFKVAPTAATRVVVSRNIIDVEGVDADGMVIGGGCSITAVDGNIITLDSSATGRYGISLETNGDKISLTGNHIDLGGSDSRGINIQDGWDRVSITGGSIANGDNTDTNSTGIFIAGGTDIKVTGVQISGVYRGVMMQGAGNTFTRIQFLGNSFSGYASNCKAIEQSTSTQSDWMVISGNSFFGMDTALDFGSQVVNNAAITFNHFIDGLGGRMIRAQGAVGGIFAHNYGIDSPLAAVILGGIGTMRFFGNGNDDDQDIELDLTSSDTTPSVRNGESFLTSSAGAAITFFDDGYDGKVITLRAVNALTSLAHATSGPGIFLLNEISRNMATGETVMLRYDSTANLWYEIGRGDPMLPVGATSAQIQAALTFAAASGGIVRLNPAGSYTVSKLTIGSNVIFDGMGATLTLAAATDDHVLECVTTESNIQVRNMIVDYNRANQSSGLASNAMNALQFENVTGLILKNVTVQNCGDIAFKLEEINDLYAENCHAENYGVEGWSVAGCDDANFAFCSGVGGDGVGGSAETGRGTPYAFEIEDAGTGTAGSTGVVLDGCFGRNNIGGGMNIRSHAGASSDVAQVRVSGFESNGNALGVNFAADNIQFVGLVSVGDTDGITFGGGTNVQLSALTITGCTDVGINLNGTMSNITIAGGEVSSVNNAFNIAGGTITNLQLSNLRLASSAGLAANLGGAVTTDFKFSDSFLTADNTTATFFKTSSGSDYKNFVLEGCTIESTHSSSNTDVLYWDNNDANSTPTFRDLTIRATSANATSLLRLRGGCDDVVVDSCRFVGEAASVIGIYAQGSGTDRLVVRDCDFNANVTQAIYGNGDNYRITGCTFKAASPIRWFTGNDHTINDCDFQDTSGTVVFPTTNSVALRLTSKGNTGLPDIEPLATFADGDSTPSVALANWHQTANTSANSITQFDSGFHNQRIGIVAGDANTTIVNNANIVTLSGSNIVMALNDIAEFKNVAGVWYQL